MLGEKNADRMQTQLLFPVLITYLIISGVWNVLHHRDWIYLAVNLFVFVFFVYLFYRDRSEQKKMESQVVESERKRTVEQIKHLAYHDDLTGLPNRRLFRDELKQTLEIAGRKGFDVTVFFVDIDRFKLINDSLGQDFGDMLLHQVAERLSRCVGEQDFLARMEGDEFAMFFPGKGPNDVERLAGSVYKHLEPPFELQDYELHLTVSIGISFFGHERENAEMLMKYADTALSRAKDQGKNNYQVYAPSMNMRSIERLTLENELHRAIQDKEFTLYYQPQYNAASGEIVGVEALIRWNHPVKGMIPPNKFIPLAEENGMIVQMGDWVLEEACRQNKEWQRRGLPRIPVSVNLSIRQFLQQNLSRRIGDILRSTGLEAKYLELEITESMTMDVDHAIACLLELKKLGIRISMDDFGTGYSSLNYLKKFPIDKLKIDQSFVRELMEDESDAAIVSTIISIAHHLNLKVIAEGVEAHRQLEYLRRQQCNEVQGYLFSPPVPARDMEKIMQKRHMGKPLHELTDMHIY